MDDYTPDEAPDPAAWMTLDERARIELALRAHNGRFPDPLHTADANPMMHASLHGVIETQIASNTPPATGEALAQLSAAGMKRHAAIHALMQVLVQFIAQLGDGGRFDHESYAAALGRLDAAGVVAGMLMRPPDSVDPGPNRAARRRAKKNRRGKKIR